MRFYKIIILSGITLAPNLALATVATSQITKLSTSVNGYLQITVASANSACTQHQVYETDGSTAAGKVFTSLAVSAYLAGKPITIYGNNSCSFNDTTIEDIVAVSF